jgi:hypothetical protein
MALTGVLKAAGDDRLAGHATTGFNVWPRSQQFAELRGSSLKTARAWELKASMMAFLLCVRTAGAEALPVVARQDGTQPAEVHDRQGAPCSRGTLKTSSRISASRHECGERSINSKIQWVRQTARGFRNQQIFVTAIYCHCIYASISA